MAQIIRFPVEKTRQPKSPFLDHFPPEHLMCRSWTLDGRDVFTGFRNNFTAETVPLVRAHVFICPECGYLMNGAKAAKLGWDSKCPYCDKTLLSDYDIYR